MRKWKMLNKRVQTLEKIESDRALKEKQNNCHHDFEFYQHNEVDYVAKCKKCDYQTCMQKEEVFIIIAKQFGYNVYQEVPVYGYPLRNKVKLIAVQGNE